MIAVRAVGSKPRAATSIRRRLLIFLLPQLTALMLASVLVNYRTALIFARTTYDQRLTDAALAIAARVTTEEGQVRLQAPPGHPAMAGLDRYNDFYFSIRGPDGRLSGGTPLLSPAPRNASSLSYGDADLNGQRVRVATFRLDTQAGVVTVSVAGTEDSRTGPPHFILGSTWLIGFIQLDVTLLLVWIGVHFGLKPLLAVRAQIEARSPRELRPLEPSAVPAEVRPLVDALNLLFEMLGEAARAQRQFVADTAHQLRTPIAGLLGQLDVMMREPSGAPLRDRLVALHDGMSSLAHSANQLLALARADPSASLADQFESVALNGLVQRVVERNIDRSIASRIDLGAETTPVAIDGNPRLLEELLANLVDNALHYTPRDGHVTVRCGVRESRPFLEVEDDGPGIPEAERGRVRQRFYRVAGSPGQGCGLGLAIVDEISRQHRADLTIEAGSGGCGTRIAVRFPITSASAPAPTNSAMAAL